MGHSRITDVSARCITDPTAAIQRSGELCPRLYQVELFQLAVERNVIVYLGTGSGKTLIAGMLTKERLDKFKGIKKLVFLAPTVSVAKQQCKALQQHVNAGVELLIGEKQVDYYEHKDWESILDANDVFVMTDQILLNALQAGFMKMNRIALLVVDECHRVKGNNPSNQIMQEFYFKLGKEERPKVLGLTASPCDACKKKKKKKKMSEVIDATTLQTLYRELEKRMDCKIVTVKDRQLVAQHAPTAKLLEVMYQPSGDDEEIMAATQRLLEVVELVRQAKHRAELREDLQRISCLAERFPALQDAGALLQLDRERKKSVVSAVGSMIAKVAHTLCTLGPWCGVACFAEAVKSGAGDRDCQAIYMLRTQEMPDYEVQPELLSDTFVSSMVQQCREQGDMLRAKLPKDFTAGVTDADLEVVTARWALTEAFSCLADLLLSFHMSGPAVVAAMKEEFKCTVKVSSLDWEDGLLSPLLNKLLNMVPPEALLAHCFGDPAANSAACGGRLVTDQVCKALQYLLQDQEQYGGVSVAISGLIHNGLVHNGAKMAEQPSNLVTGKGQDTTTAFMPGDGRVANGIDKKSRPVSITGEWGREHTGAPAAAACGDAADASDPCDPYVRHKFAKCEDGRAVPAGPASYHIKHGADCRVRESWSNPVPGMIAHGSQCHTMPQGSASVVNGMDGGHAIMQCSSATAPGSEGCTQETAPKLGARMTVGALNGAGASTGSENDACMLMDAPCVLSGDGSVSENWCEPGRDMMASAGGTGKYYKTGAVPAGEGCSGQKAEGQLARSCKAPERNKPPSWSCLIFVQRKMTAIALTKLLQALGQAAPPLAQRLACNMLMGFGGAAVESMNAERQQKVLDDFRKGVYCCLVATSVAEEGLDLPSCQLVMRFDPASNARAFQQSRGRARMHHSRIVVMLNAQDPTAWEDVQHSLWQEQEVQRMAEQGANSDEYEDSDDEEEMPVGEEYRIPSTGAVVTMCSAKSMLFQYCQKLPHDTYTGIPRPRYRTVRTDGLLAVMYQSEVFLPNNATVHKAQGAPQRRKRWAQASASLAACRELHTARALTDNLVPVVEALKRDEELRAEQEMRQGTPSIVINPVIPHVLTAPAPDRAPGAGSALPAVTTTVHIYTFRLTQARPSNTHPLTAVHHWCVLLPHQIPSQLPEFPVWLPPQQHTEQERRERLQQGEERQQEVEQGHVVVEGHCSADLTTQQLANLQKGHNYLLGCIFHKGGCKQPIGDNPIPSADWAESSSGAWYVIAPAVWSDSKASIDWELVHAMSLGEKPIGSLMDLTVFDSGDDYVQRAAKQKLGALLSGRLARTQYNGLLYLCMGLSEPALNLFSPFPNTKMRHPCHNNSKQPPEDATYKDYLEYYEKQRNQKGLITSQPLIHAVPRGFAKPKVAVSHFLKPHRPKFAQAAEDMEVEQEEEVMPRNDATPAAQEARGDSGPGMAASSFLASDEAGYVEVDLVPQLCALLPLPMCHWATVHCLPQLLHRLYWLLAAQQLAANLLAPRSVHDIPLLPILSAITTKTARDYFLLERYELLGDTVLKFLTDLFVYHDNAAHNEGMLTTRKDILVSNARLASVAKKKLLHHYLNYRCFEQQHWLPPGRKHGKAVGQKVAGKSVADMVEALLGVAFHHCGMQAAAEVATQVGLLPTALVQLIHTPPPIRAPPCKHVHPSEKQLQQLQHQPPQPPQHQQQSSHQSQQRQELAGEQQPQQTPGMPSEAMQGVPAEASQRLLNGNAVEQIQLPLAEDQLMDQSHLDAEQARQLFLLQHKALQQGLINIAKQDGEQTSTLASIATAADSGARGNQRLHVAEAATGFPFRDEHQHLLREALTHASWPLADPPCYQRLEFLGDAAVDITVTYMAFLIYPDATPLMLTALRSLMVSNDRLAYWAVLQRLHTGLLHLSSHLQADLQSYLEQVEKTQEHTEVDAVEGSLAGPCPEGATLESQQCTPAPPTKFHVETVCVAEIARGSGTNDQSKADSGQLGGNRSSRKRKKPDGPHMHEWAKGLQQKYAPLVRHAPKVMADLVESVSAAVFIASNQDLLAVSHACHSMGVFDRISIYLKDVTRCCVDSVALQNERQTERAAKMVRPSA